nr:head GIN domain-containing protein [uncultured Chryseobacterium sp.]
MKYSTLLLFSGLISFSACNDKTEKSKWLPDISNKEHGPLKQKEFNGDFDEIEVSQAIEAEVIKSDIEKVVISAPSNIIDEVLVERRGGKVHIHYKTGIRVMNTNRVTAKIYAKDFVKLIANSAASITVKDKFTQEKTEVEASSAASITGHLEANDLEISVDSSSSFDGKIWAVDLDVDASSAASISLSGKSKNAEMSSSSGSSINGREVIVENLKADASSGASLEISASSTVDAEASSGGSVTVYKKGNVTTVKKEENSGGSVSVQ